MNFRALALLVLCAPLTGCMRSLKVQHSVPLAPSLKSTSLPGLPFYFKIGVCKQESVWLEPQYTLHFQIGEGIGREKVLSAQGFGSKPVQDFILEPAGTFSNWDMVLRQPSPASFNEGDSSIAGKEIPAQEAVHNWVLVSNSAAVEAVVDYGNVYYINSARPLAGSTQVDAKLAADGTLTEGSAQLDDKTLSTIVDSISSLVSSASTVMKALAVSSNGGETSYKVSVTTRVYKHTHSQYTNGSTPFSCMKSPAEIYGGNFSVSEERNTNKEAKKDDNTMSVSGTVTLPKAASTTKP